MTTTTTTPRTRVANHQIDQLFRELVPFENYNRSIIATKTHSAYTVTHWDTEIARINLTEGERVERDAVYFFNIGYYSQTTSTLQGRILRNLFTRQEVDNLLDWYWNNDKPLARRLARLAGRRR